MSGNDPKKRNDTGVSDAPPPACESLVFNTQLTSPKAAFLRLLTPGDELPVVIDKQGGRSVIVAFHDGDVVGGITSPGAQGLRKCIEAGFNYSATVLDVGSGQIRVRVHCVS